MNVVRSCAKPLPENLFIFAFPLMREALDPGVQARLRNICRMGKDRNTVNPSTDQTHRKGCPGCN